MGTHNPGSPSVGTMRSRLAWLALLVMSARAQGPGVIAYTRAPDGGPPWPVQDIYTVRADGTGVRALTSDGHSHHASWSPDGRHILFIHDSALSSPPPYRETEDTKSRHAIELSVMDADGNNRRVLRVIQPVIYSAAWSPDGKTLAISAATSTEVGQEPRVGLFTLPANGKGSLRLLLPSAWEPSWSPDGKKLVFVVEEPRGRWSIHTANAEGTGDARLTDPAVNSGSPAWLPDEKRIAFSQFQEDGREQVLLMNADGSSVRTLTNSLAWSCRSPSWAPDGKQLVVSCRAANVPCGMGISSTGQPMPECARRLVLVQADGDQPPRMLTDHDAAMAEFAPRRVH